LFSHGGLVFAVARAQPGARSGLTQLGSLFARKRTALWWIDPGRAAPAGGSGEPRLVWLSDLPSAGDTSYAGVVLNPILRPTVRSPRARRIRKISAATR
jgi:hypothetical protein